MREDDYYQLLGVSRYATRDAVRRAFRTRVRAIHPDCNPQIPLAAEKTRKLISAYKVLADPARRKQYDLSLVPRAAPPVLAHHCTNDFYSQSTSRTLMVVFAVVLVACVALLVGRGILADQPRVFRPVLDIVDLSTVDGACDAVIYLYPSDELESYLVAGSRPNETLEWPMPNGAEVYADTHLHASAWTDRRRSRKQAPFGFAIP